MATGSSTSSSPSLVTARLETSVVMTGEGSSRTMTVWDSEPGFRVASMRRVSRAMSDIPGCDTFSKPVAEKVSE